MLLPNSGGYLVTKGADAAGSSLVRWFLLDHARLCMFRTSELAQPLGSLDIDDAVIEIDNYATRPEHEEFVFRVVTRKRTWVLAAKSMAERRAWVQLLVSRTSLGRDAELLDSMDSEIAEVEERLWHQRLQELNQLATASSSANRSSLSNSVRRPMLSMRRSTRHPNGDAS